MYSDFLGMNAPAQGILDDGNHGGGVRAGCGSGRSGDFATGSSKTETIGEGSVGGEIGILKGVTNLKDGFFIRFNRHKL
ncbi:hypothetical protein SBDP1_1340008 [Syntrophobacter sp. SbD1]|nr:hypothetical protein SBDP1_1340008 [Syntrophobacter sp. SbD1]